LKADYRILINFGTTFLDRTCHQTAIEVSTSPNIAYASALPGKIRTLEIGVKINKKRQQPSIILLNIDFNSF